jgi:hypothetical protein
MIQLVCTQEASFILVLVLGIYMAGFLRYYEVYENNIDNSYSYINLGISSY